VIGVAPKVVKEAVDVFVLMVAKIVALAHAKVHAKGVAWGHVKVLVL